MGVVERDSCAVLNRLASMVEPILASHESLREENPAVETRLEVCAGSKHTDQETQRDSTEELTSRVHESVKAISAVVAGPGSKLNKADINSIADHSHEILAIAALSLRLPEAKLEVANAKLEVANTRLEVSRAGQVASEGLDASAYAQQ
ncbi:hypothetical protein EVAR_61240_1 [Eumeta japonica]|uniref:Talin-1 n=1 Tax=Eumeta variegata TaxID=151549 RepID=A0A4C1SM90_EUMVA|nr:hypothetical protein EVAR_61240_1 [Eumeta japonica]